MSHYSHIYPWNTSNYYSYKITTIVVWCSILITCNRRDLTCAYMYLGKLINGRYMEGIHLVIQFIVLNLICF